MNVPRNLSEKEYFILACFSDSLEDFYKEYISQSKGRGQSFDSGLVHKYWAPSKICCESGEELTKDNIDIKIGYWTPFIWKPIRKDLKQNAMKFEALECQKNRLQLQ